MDRGWYSWEPGLFGGFRFSREAEALAPLATESRYAWEDLRSERPQVQILPGAPQESERDGSRSCPAGAGPASVWAGLAASTGTSMPPKP
jgi:hypothetical protein